MTDSAITLRSADPAELARFEAKREKLIQEKSEAVLELQAAGASESTQYNYLRAMVRFFEWRKETLGLPWAPKKQGPAKRKVDLSELGQSVAEHLTRFPADDGQLTFYLLALEEAKRSPAVAAQAVAAASKVADWARLPDPVGQETRKTLRGIRRKGRDRGRGQVKGLSWKVVRKMVRTARDQGTKIGKRNAAIIAVMSDGMLRISEAAAIRTKDLKEAWDWDDENEEDILTGRLTIRASKTDQTGRGAVQFLGTDTMRLIRTWMKAAGIKEGSDGPLFRRVRRIRAWGGDFEETVQPDGICSRTVSRAIKSIAEKAGVSGYVAGHSLRVGSAQAMAREGASLVMMQTEGRWKSPAMPGHYAKAQMAARGGIARFKYGLKKR